MRFHRTDKEIANGAMGVIELKVTTPLSYVRVSVNRKNRATHFIASSFGLKPRGKARSIFVSL